MNHQIEIGPFEALREIGLLTNEGLIIFNIAQDKFVHINSVARKLLGIESDYAEQAIESLMRMVLEEDKEYLKNQFELITHHSSKVDVELRLKKNDGTISFICCNGYLVLDKTYLVVSIRDISKAKQHENYLIEFGTRKNTVLDVLMHHISGALLLMQNLTLEAEKSIANSDLKNVKTYLGLLDDNSKHCIGMINNLMEDEYNESSKIYAVHARVDIVENIFQVYKHLSQIYKEKVFAFNTSSSPIFVKTDEFKLLQVINNFTSNAIKFTASKGQIAISLTEEDNEVIISIADNGIGIREELKPFIFDRFSVAGRVGLQGEKSTGLGLSINVKLVKILGGRMWFESTLGLGSSFHLALPKV